MKQKTHTDKQQIIASLQRNPKYKGRDILIIGPEVRILSTRSKTARMRTLTTLVKQYPNETPLITFIPKSEILILLF